MDWLVAVSICGRQSAVVEGSLAGTKDVSYGLLMETNDRSSVLNWVLAPGDNATKQKACLPHLHHCISAARLAELHQNEKASGNCPPAIAAHPRSSPATFSNATLCKRPFNTAVLGREIVAPPLFGLLQHGTHAQQRAQLVAA